MTGDGLLELRPRTTLVRGINPRGARHWDAASRRKLHMRVVGVKRALHCLTKRCSRRLIGLRASPLLLF